MNEIEQMNRLSAAAGSWALSHLATTAAVLFLVGLIWFALRKRFSAALGCWLFLLVIVKPLIPFQIGIPQSWLPFQAEAVIPVLMVADADSSAPIAMSPVPPRAAAPASVPIEVEAVRLSWQSYLMIAWAAAVAGLWLRFAFLQVRTTRWLESCSRLPELEDEVAQLAGVIGLRPRVRVISNSELDTPMVCGLFRRSLLLPAGFVDQLDPDQRRWVLLHELAHLKRGDLWVLAFQRLAQSAFFFNPSIWIANRAINRLREYACDDVALVHSKLDRRSCGEGFLRVVERAHTQPIPGAAALALFEKRSDSKRRLARILDSKRRLASGLGFGGAVILVALGMVPLPGLRAQDVADESLQQEPDRLRGIFGGGSELPVEIPETIGLVLKADGKIYESGDNGVAIPEDRLFKYLSRAVEINPEVRVVFSGGDLKTLKYQEVVALLDRLKKSGVADVTISTSQPQAVPVGVQAGAAPGGLDLAPVPVSATTKFVEVTQDPEQLQHRLAAPVAGIVKEVLVEAGAAVKAGDVLLKLDSRQAEGALGVAEARLEAANGKMASEEALMLVQISMQKSLVDQLTVRAEQRSVTSAQLDGAKADLDRLVTLQKNLRAPALEMAELEQVRSLLLQYQIVAPVDGTIEKVGAKLGEYVSPEKPAVILQRKFEVRTRIETIPGSASPARGR